MDATRIENARIWLELNSKTPSREMVADPAFDREAVLAIAKEKAEKAKAGARAARMAKGF